MKNTPVVDSMRKLSGRYPGYGYRLVNVFLAHDVIVMGDDKCNWLWTEMGLQAPRKRSRRRIATSQPRSFAPAK